jgi:hypothetical protein
MCTARLVPCPDFSHIPGCSINERSYSVDRCWNSTDKVARSLSEKAEAPALVAVGGTIAKRFCFPGRFAEKTLHPYTQFRLQGSYRRIILTRAGSLPLSGLFLRQAAASIFAEFARVQIA